mgnify:CR=1 FL=1
MEQLLFAIALTFCNAVITLILVPALKNFFDRISKYEITLANLPGLVKSIVEESINRSLKSMTDRIEEVTVRVTKLEQDRAQQELKIHSLQKAIEAMEDRASHKDQRRLSFDNRLDGHEG